MTGRVHDDDDDDDGGGDDDDDDDDGGPIPLQLHVCTVHIHMYLSENQKRLSCLSGGCSHGLPVIQKSTRSKGRYQSRQSSYLYLHVPCTLGRQSGNVIAVAG